MNKYLLGVVMLVSASAQQTVSVTYTIPDDAAASFMLWRAHGAPQCTASLTATCAKPDAAQVASLVGAADTTIAVVDSTLLTVFPSDVLIENEVIRVCSKTVNVLNLTGCTGGGRAKYGSVAATHVSGAAVHFLYGTNPIEAVRQITREAMRNIFLRFPSPAMQAQLTARNTADVQLLALLDAGVQ